MHGEEHEPNKKNRWLYRPCKELKTIQNKCDCPHYVTFTELMFWDACPDYAKKWYPMPESDEDVNLDILEEEEW